MGCTYWLGDILNRDNDSVDIGPNLLGDQTVLRVVVFDVDAQALQNNLS